MNILRLLPLLALAATPASSEPTLATAPPCSPPPAQTDTGTIDRIAIQIYYDLHAWAAHAKLENRHEYQAGFDRVLRKHLKLLPPSLSDQYVSDNKINLDPIIKLPDDVKEQLSQLNETLSRYNSLAPDEKAKEALKTALRNVRERYNLKEVPPLKKSSALNREKCITLSIFLEMMLDQQQNPLHGKEKKQKIFHILERLLPNFEPLPSDFREAIRLAAEGDDSAIRTYIDRQHNDPSCYIFFSRNRDTLYALLKEWRIQRNKDTDEQYIRAVIRYMDWNDMPPEEILKHLQPLSEQKTQTP